MVTILTADGQLDGIKACTEQCLDCEVAYATAEAAVCALGKHLAPWNKYVALCVCQGRRGWYTECDWRQQRHTAAADHDFAQAPA